MDVGLALKERQRLWERKRDILDILRNLDDDNIVGKSNFQAELERINKEIIENAVSLGANPVDE